MACACGTGGTKTETWIVNSSSGSKTFSSEIEAKAEAQRSGGTVRKQ